MLEMMHVGKPLQGKRAGSRFTSFVSCMAFQDFVEDCQNHPIKRSFGTLVIGLHNIVFCPYPASVVGNRCAILKKTIYLVCS